jgi:transposase
MATRSRHLADALIPPSPDLRLDHVELADTSATVRVTSAAPTAACPRCHHCATRIRGAYVRTLADLPWSGRSVRLQLRVRKFACDLPHCPQRIFTERLPNVTIPYARRTTRLTDVVRAVAFAVGGEGGSRLLHRLRMAVSATTVLRVIRRTGAEVRPTPRVLGIDDWARRKGQTYGSILVDLEHHQVVDLLPDRTATTVATWLRGHPGVEIVSRDRAEAYAEGAALGAPQAIHVADRWHLLKNLGDALEEVLQQHRAQIKQVFVPTSPEAAPAAALHVNHPPPVVPARVLAERAAKRQARFACYTQVLALRQRGMTLRAIAAEVGLNPKTVGRWMQTATFPERVPRPSRRKCLDPYTPYLVERWNAGCHNATLLWHEIKQQGYGGGCTRVRDFLAPFRPRRGQRSGMDERTTQHAAVTDGVPPTIRTLRGCVLRRPDQITQHEQNLVHRLRTAHTVVEAAVQWTQAFAAMVRQRQPEHLEPWLWQVANSEVASLRRFAAGIQRDKAAILAGLTLEWSQGQVEGQVNRLKLVKRSMYGRANFDLLRLRVLNPP